MCKTKITNIKLYKDNTEDNIKLTIKNTINQSELLDEFHVEDNVLNNASWYFVVDLLVC